MCAFVKKRCDLYLNNKVTSCTECEQTPCESLQKLSKRYETRYHMSMVKNLQCIKEYGMDKFLESEQEKWRCPECGGVICCHNGVCYSCGLDKLRTKKQVYRWGDE
jgi:ubiquitin C-terminal hydrolase